MGDEREVLPIDEREAASTDDDVEAHTLPSDEREAAPLDERESFLEGDKRERISED